MIVPSPYQYLGSFALAFLAGAVTAAVAIAQHAYHKRRASAD